jgi:hypothetical protein
MRSTDQEPTIGKASLDGESLDHPAFGQISVSRVSGDVVLYGSDFVHHGYVVVRITKSTLTRRLARDSHFADARPYIEVAMSESQWATFVSSFNLGSGVPCTVQRRDGKGVPSIPLRDSGQEYSKEANAALVQAVKELQESRDRVAENVAGLPKKKQAEVLDGLDQAIRKLTDNLPFVVDSFSKFMEKRTEKAKVEVNAFINTSIQRAGLQALGVDTTPPLLLPGADE